MAIKMTYSLDTGFSADHWQTLDARINVEKKTITVIYGLWKNTAAKTAGKGYVDTYRFEWKNVATQDFDENDNTIFDNRYDDFMDACNDEPTMALVETEVLKATHFDLFLQSGTAVSNV